jgi:hypothetical protein
MLALASFNDIDQLTPIPVSTTQEQIVDDALSELHPFEDYPFQVWEDTAIQENVESIQ